MTGIKKIAAERRRQYDQESWDESHDDQHDMGQLATAALCYLKARSVGVEKHRPPSEWPWGPHWWKPTPDDRIRELVKAGALIAAEIDRLERLHLRPTKYTPPPGPDILSNRR